MFFLTLLMLGAALTAMPFCAYVALLYVIGFFIGIANAILHIGNHIRQVKGLFLCRFVPARYRYILRTSLQVDVLHLIEI